MKNLEKVKESRKRVYTRFIKKEQIDYHFEIAEIEKAKKLFPKKPLLYNLLGALYEAAELYEQAVDFYTWYLLNIGSLIPCSISFINDKDAMIQKLNSAIENNPENPNLFFIRGKLFGHLQKEKALLDYSKAIELKPDFLIAYLERASIQKRNVKPEGAIADLLTAIKLNNSIALIHYELGEVYYGAKEHELALPYFNKAIKLSPKWLEIYFSRASAHAALKNYKFAIKDLSTCIKLERKEFVNSKVFYLTYKANLYMNLYDYKNALKNYTKAIKLDSKESKDFNELLPEIYKKRANCYKAMNKNIKAKADLDMEAALKEKYKDDILPLPIVEFFHTGKLNV